MYTMLEACRKTGITYEALKFYCNEGLVPNVKRDKNNRRVFDDHDVAWVKSLACLKNCGMSIQEMKEYLALCLEGPGSIPQRKLILQQKREELLRRVTELEDAIRYVDKKQRFYDDVLCGKRPYISSLIPPPALGEPLCAAAPEQAPKPHR